MPANKPAEPPAAVLRSRTGGVRGHRLAASPQDERDAGNRDRDRGVQRHPPGDGVDAVITDAPEDEEEAEHASVA